MKSLSSSLTSQVVSSVTLQWPQSRRSRGNRSSLSPKQDLGPWRNYGTAMLTTRRKRRPKTLLWQRGAWTPTAIHGAGLCSDRSQASGTWGWECLLQGSLKNPDVHRLRQTLLWGSLHRGHDRQTNVTERPILIPNYCAHFTLLSPSPSRIEQKKEGEIKNEVSDIPFP